MDVESELLFFYIACGWCAWIIELGSPIGAVRSCHTTKTKGIRANTFSTAKLLSAYIIVKSAFQTICSFAIPNIGRWSLHATSAFVYWVAACLLAFQKQQEFSVG